MLMLAGAAMGQCREPRWTEEFSTPERGLIYDGGAWPGDGYALQVYEGGPGGRWLYVGGFFRAAGPVQTNAIARWDGKHWSDVGGGLGPQDCVVTGMGIHDPDGPGPQPPVLIVVGNFNSAGGQPVSNVAAFDGARWSPFGSIDTAAYYQCPVVDYDADGSGPLLPAAILARSTVRRFDGTNWTTIPGSPGGILALAVYDEDGDGPLSPALFAGSDITPGLYKWDGTTWSVVGGGLSRSAEHRCCALRVIDEDGPGPMRPMLWAGGTFTTAGGVPVSNIARWDGQQWSAIGGGLAGQVEDIVAVDYTGVPGSPTVFATTTFNESIARWDGVSWSIVGQADSANAIFVLHQLAAFDDGDGQPALYFVAAALRHVNQTPSYGIARFACACYANCDASTAEPTLNVNDFVCFMSRFAGGESYANCDASTVPPVLNVNDFLCFQSRFVAGCR